MFLIVEDNHQLLALWRRLVPQLDLDAVIVDNGDEARRLVEDTQFCGLVLDQQLPGASGTDILAAARQPGSPNAETPVIFTSAAPPHPLPDDVVVLRKPVPLAAVVKRLLELVGSGQRESANQQRDL